MYGCLSILLFPADNCDQFKMYILQAKLEESMFRKCSWAVPYAQKSIDSFTKMQKYKECMALKHLRCVAQSYLDGVTPDDKAYIKEKDKNERAAKAGTSHKAIRRPEEELHNSWNRKSCDDDEMTAETVVAVDSDLDSNADSENEEWDPEIHDVIYGSDEEADDERQMEQDIQFVE